MKIQTIRLSCAAIALACSTEASGTFFLTCEEDVVNGINTLASRMTWNQQEESDWPFGWLYSVGFALTDGLTDDEESFFILSDQPNNEFLHYLVYSTQGGTYSIEGEANDFKVVINYPYSAQVVWHRPVNDPDVCGPITRVLP